MKLKECLGIQCACQFLWSHPEIDDGYRRYNAIIGCSKGKLVDGSLLFKIRAIHLLLLSVAERCWSSIELAQLSYLQNCFITRSKAELLMEYT